MPQVVTALPAIVEISVQGQPVAFWWRNRHYFVSEHLCHWDDRCCISAHWLVRTDTDQRVTLIYDRAIDQWSIDWACA